MYRTMYHIPYLLKQSTMGKPRFKKSHDVKVPLFEVISTYAQVSFVGFQNIMQVQRSTGDFVDSGTMTFSRGFKVQTLRTLWQGSIH